MGTVASNSCVLGLGRTGVAAASWLARHGEPGSRVALFGGAKSFEGPLSAGLAEEGVRVVVGPASEDVASDEAAPFDLAVVSPGIPPHSTFFRSALAASKELIGEPELAFRASPERWVAITGTNGKTTTTSLTAHLLQSGGQAAECIGNIGIAAISRVDERPQGEWFVAELSSFQLETTSQLAPQTACLLNVTPDHVSWHGSLEAYAAAKERIFQNFVAGQLAVVSEEDSWCAAVCERLEARGVRVCRVNVHGDPQTRDAAFVRDGSLVVRLDGRELLEVAQSSILLQGEHNAQNALAASAMVLSLGVAPDAIARGLASFSPLEHRIEPCGTVDGVHFVNDSKATNTDSVEKALTAFEPGRVLILLGGRDKGTDLGSLMREVGRCCRVAVCYGEAGERMAQALEEARATGVMTEVVRAPHMADALDAACARANSGDTVLLSPACASFDEFSGFEERGRVFKELVSQRERRGTGGER